MSRTILAASLLCVCFATSAQAQEHQPAHFDWKPVAVYAAGAAMDTASTMRFLRNGSGCVEATTRFTLPPFTPAHPDTVKMWRYDALGTASIFAVNGLAYSAVRRAPGSRVARIASLASKAYGYGAGAWRAHGGIRNVSKCGW